MTAEPMIARGAHYTALLDTIDHQGATKLHAREREQLLEAADVLLFGEPDSEQTVRLLVCKSSIRTSAQLTVCSLSGSPNSKTSAASSSCSRSLACSLVAPW